MDYDETDFNGWRTGTMKRIFALFLAVVLLPACALGEDNWYCGNCGYANNTNFCIYCGAARPTWRCTACGTENTLNYCGNCGAARPSSASVATQTPGSLQLTTAAPVLTGAIQDGGRETVQDLFSAWIGCIWNRDAQGILSLLPADVRNYAVQREGSLDGAAAYIQSLFTDREWMAQLTASTAINQTGLQEHALGTGEMTYSLGENGSLTVQDTCQTLFTLEGVEDSSVQGCFAIQVNGLWYLAAPDGSSVFWRI